MKNEDRGGILHAKTGRLKVAHSAHLLVHMYEPLIYSKALSAASVSPMSCS